MPFYHGHGGYLLSSHFYRIVLQPLESTSILLHVDVVHLYTYNYKVDPHSGLENRAFKHFAASFELH
jgi:hypothetical protein